MIISDLLDEWLHDSGRTQFNIGDMLTFGEFAYHRGAYNPAKCGDCGRLAHKGGEICLARDEPDYF